MVRVLAPLEVGICCSDLDRLVRFYADVLCVKLISTINVPAEKSKEAAASPCGYRVARLELPSGERLKLLEPETSPQPQSASEFMLERRNTTYLTFIVDDLETVRDRLERAGAKIVTGRTPVAVRPGVGLVFARDPEDNLIEFVRYDDLEAYRPTST